MPQLASAAITLSTTNATIRGSGLDFFNLANDTESVSDSSLFTSFNHSVHATTHGHSGVELDDFASQDTEINLDSAGDTLTIKSSGSFSINHKAPDPVDRENIQSSASSDLEIQFCIDEPHSFSASASGQIQAPNGSFTNGRFKNFFFAGFVGVVLPASNGVGTGLIVMATVNTDIPDAPSGGTNSSGVLPAGCYFVEADLDPNPGLISPLFVPADPDKTKQNPPTASGSYQLQVNVGPEPAPDTVHLFPWIGPSGGGFGNQANWKPDNGIPTFVDGSEVDTALFQGLGTLTVDLSSSAASSRSAPAPASAPTPVGQCAGVVTRAIGRLEVDNTRELEPLSGTLALDSLSFSEPSLTVLDGGRLEVDQSAVCVQNALIGGGGRGDNFVDVSNPGFFQTLGRLSVGQSAPALLSVSNGGVAQSEEVRLGDGSQTGAAEVDDATWNTGNIAVGFQSTGELTIQNAASMTSEQGFVASQLPGGPVPGFGSKDVCLGRTGTAGGVEVKGTNSSWTLQNLFIGPLGCVDVSENALVNAVAGDTGLGDVLVGANDSGQAHLLVNNGGALIAANSLTIGDGGAADLILLATGGSEVVTDGLIIGKGDSTATFGDGEVVVHGDDAVTTPSLTSNFVDIGNSGGSGSLKLDRGAIMLTDTTAEVGVNGLGIVSLNGDEGNTTWQIGNSLTIGGASSNGNGLVIVGNSTIDVGSASSPGSVTVNRFGTLTGNAGNLNKVLTHSGTVTNNGRIEGPMELDGNYDPSSTGTLDSTISGLHKVPASSSSETVIKQSIKTPPLPPQGPIVITGNADLTNTTLELSFVNGFAPKQGAAFQVVQVSGTASGNFANVKIDGLAPGASFSVDPVSGMATALNDTAALPVVTLKGPTKLKESSKGGAKLIFSRKGATTNQITVNYRVGGTAQNGIDYGTLPGSAVIPAKKKSVTVAIIPYNDGRFKPDGTIDITLLPGDGYSVGLKSSISVLLAHVDPKTKKKK